MAWEIPDACKVVACWLSCMFSINGRGPVAQPILNPEEIIFENESNLITRCSLSIEK